MLLGGFRLWTCLEQSLLIVTHKQQRRHTGTSSIVQSQWTSTWQMCLSPLLISSTSSVTARRSHIAACSPTVLGRIFWRRFFVYATVLNLARTGLARPVTLVLTDSRTVQRLKATRFFVLRLVRRGVTPSIFDREKRSFCHCSETMKNKGLEPFVIDAS